MNEKQTVRIKISENFIEESVDFKNGYKSRTNIVKNENGNLAADCHSI
jgi:hypothetical protein